MTQTANVIAIGDAVDNEKFKKVREKALATEVQKLKAGLEKKYEKRLKKNWKASIKHFSNA